LTAATACLSTTRARPCRIGVAATSDGGARFTLPVTVSAWPCASNPPAGQVAFGSRGDGFLYGPGLFVTHDGGRTWAAANTLRDVLAVAPLGRSVWLLQARCWPVKPAQAQDCPLRMLTSGNEGRTWAPAASQPPASAPGYGGSVPVEPAAGRSFLVRTGPQSGYVAALAVTPYPVVPGHQAQGRLWFTANGGRSWSRRATPCTGMGYAMSAAPDGELFAVCAGEPGAGQQGKTAERSLDGGRTWTRGESCGIGRCTDALGSGYLGQVAAVDARTVYLVGDRSPLLATHDGLPSAERAGHTPGSHAMPLPPMPGNTPVPPIGTPCLGRVAPLRQPPIWVICMHTCIYRRLAGQSSRFASPAASRALRDSPGPRLTSLFAHG